MKKCLLLVFIIGAFIASYAEEMTVYPTDDMYVDCLTTGTHPETQIYLCRATTMEDERIMFNFDVSRVVTLESAIFNFHRYFSCPSGGGLTMAKIYPITEEWDEATWDCHTFPAYDESTEISVYFDGPSYTQDTWYAINITIMVEQWVYGMIPNYGFVIIADMGEPHSKFDSSEVVNTEMRPSLVINGTLPQTEDVVISGLSAVNYPNPFNPETLISFNISDADGGTLRIFNLAGQVMETRNYDTGDQQFLWKADNYSTGIYFYSIETEKGNLTRRMTLIK